MRFLIALLFLTSILSGDNQRYCNDLSDQQRSTLIYLDMESTSDRNFANSLFENVTNNLLPHERVQILTINPSTSSISQVFNSCAPILAPERIEEIRSEGRLRYALGGNPIDRAKEDLTFFQATIRGVLAEVYNESQNLSPSDSKGLVELLYGEGHQFRVRPMSRVVICSNMIQNSPLISKDQLFSRQGIQSTLDEYKTDFNHAEVYVYTMRKELGVSRQRELVSFWRNYFHLNNAHLSYFNDELAIPRFSDLYHRKFAGVVRIGDRDYSSSLYLNYDNRGVSSNSWLIIPGVEKISLQGNIRTSQNTMSAKLKPASPLADSINLFDGSESIEFEIRGTQLSGNIMFENTNLIINGQAVGGSGLGITMEESTR